MIPADKRIVVFDLETSGLNPARDSIIEVGTLTIEGGTITDHQQWFVACPTPLDPKITDLTGIRDQDLTGGASLAETARRLHEIIQPYRSDLLLVGHNIIRFDNLFLRSLWSQHGHITLDIDAASFDTCCWTRVDRLGLPVPPAGQRTAAWQRQILNMRTHVRANLAAAVEHYGVVQTGEAHRAQHDVEACWAIAQQQWMRQHLRETTERLMAERGEATWTELFEEVKQ